MVVRLRLARWGRRNRPFYRIVAADSRSRRDGRHLDIVGAYNPLPHSAVEASVSVKRVWLNVERIKHWIAQGAQPSETGTAGILSLSPRSTSSSSHPPPSSPEGPST